MTRFSKVACLLPFVFTKSLSNLKVSTFISVLKTADFLDTKVNLEAQAQVSKKIGILAANETKATQFSCPQKIRWEGFMSDDIDVQSPIMNVLLMDGRRRWMDIEKLVYTVLFLIV
jgi:hypothetical protein